MTSKQSDPRIIETLERALELTEEVLGEITRIAIGEIRGGLEAGNHVEAAERDMRSALRQLVLAERELQAKSALRAGLDGQTERANGRPGALPEQTRG